MVSLPSLVAIDIVVVEMFLVVEEEDSRCSCFSLPLLLSLKDMVWKHTVYHINNSNPSHTLKAAIGVKYENNLCQSAQKQR